MNDRYYAHTYPNRTLCNVLEEMRECYKTRNFAALLGLIQEAQHLGNRMESGLSDKHDLEEMREQRSKMNKELKKLQTELDELELKKKFVEEKK